MEKSAQMNERKIKKSIPLFLGSFLLTNFLPFYFFTLIFLYERTNSFLVVSQVMALNKVMTSFFNLFTGFLADRILGRKASYFLGSFFNFISYIALTLSITHGMIFIWSFAIIRALSIALRQASTAPLLFDLLAHMKKQNLFHKVYGNIYSWGYLFRGTLVILISILLYERLDSLLYFCIMASGLSLILIPFIFNPFQHHKHVHHSLKETYQHLKRTFAVFFENRQLKWLSIERLFRFHFLFGGLSQVNTFYRDFFSQSGLGLFFGFFDLVSGAASKTSHFISKKFGYLKTFVGFEAIRTFIGGLSFIFPSPAMLIIFKGADSMSPILEMGEQSLIQHHLSSKERATQLSLLNVSGAFLYAISSLFFGWLADLYSLQTSILIALSLRIFLFPIFIQIFKPSKK
ncbi:MAG: hypothetical protein JXR30_00690 [Alphaproteobacteria bacterium]|nr:hypothetical protein [Alphaproteobacteria bacterium]